MPLHSGWGDRGRLCQKTNKKKKEKERKGGKEGEGADFGVEKLHSLWFLCGESWVRESLGPHLSDSRSVKLSPTDFLISYTVSFSLLN